MDNDLVVNGKEKEAIVTGKDIKDYLCPTATEKEIFMALGIIKSFGLNPFKREVHIIKYGTSPAQVVVGYETYLKRAERTNKLNGFKVEISEDGKKAVCTIYRKDWTQPFIWEVDKSEFDKNQSTWKSMGKFMLKKVCLAQAFRICFPDEMGGLPYIVEEIHNEIEEKEQTKVSIPNEEEKLPEETQKKIDEFLSEEKKELTTKEKIDNVVSAISKIGEELKLSKKQFLDIMEKHLGTRDEKWRDWNDLIVLDHLFDILVKEKIKERTK